MSLIEIARDQRNNPLDVVEHMAAGNNWPFERAGEDEIGIVVTGRWTNYQVSFTWMSDIEALHLACAFDMKVPDARLTEVQQPHRDRSTSNYGSDISTSGRRTASSCSAMRWFLPAGSPRRTGNARRCSAPRSIPASVTSRHFSS